MQGDALVRPRRRLAGGGQRAEAAEALEQALERYERKKNLAMVGQVGLRLEALREEEVARRPLEALLTKAESDANKAKFVGS